MATSKWAAVVSALYDVLGATSGYRKAEDYGTGIPVFLGPDIGAHEMDASSWLTIAWAGTPDSPESPGGIQQEVAGMAASDRPRDETGTIRCRACCQLGDISLMDALEAAQTLMATVETAIRTDPYVGLGAASNLRWAQTQSGEAMWDLTDGAVAWWTFELTYKARL